MKPESDVRMRGFARRADVDDVRDAIRAVATPLDSESVALAEAAGRVLASDVVSPSAVPGFDRAMMDGYAVRGEETFGATEYAPLRFRVVGEILPGRTFEGSIGKGEAARIMTGAPVPNGADAVVMAEHASESDEGGKRVVDVAEPVPPGRHVGPVGEDIAVGAAVLARGRRLRAQDVGVLASIGVAEVDAVRRPTVRLVVTGDELLPAGSTPSGVRIVDSNSPMLAALVARDGGIVRFDGITPDGRDSVEAAIADSTEDIVLVSGGSSVGAEDHAPIVVADRGELLAHGVAMRPSSPAGFGRLGDRLVFLLPGNPVSCLCAYDFFAGPAVRARGGRAFTFPYQTCRGLLSEKISSAVGRVDYVRVRVDHDADTAGDADARLRVEPLAVRGASLLSSTTRSDGFVIVPRDSEGAPAGAEVVVHLYDEHLEIHDGRD